MKIQRFLLIFIILSSTPLYANQRAITNTGDEVILKSDGTWVYANQQEQISIETNQKKFQKSEDATFLLKSKINNSAIWINPKTWSFKKATENEDAEYEFQLKNKGLYGMIISEDLEMPVETLADVALEIAQDADPNAEVVSKEYRVVNGKKILHMVYNMSYKGMGITYLSYYYSDTSGVTQYITYSGTSTLQKYEKDAYDFLNGLTSQ